MALDQLDKNKQDERYNPSGAGRDLYDQENSTDAFDDIAKNYDKTADSGAENKNIAKAKDGEENPMNYAPGERGDSKSQHGRRKTKINIKTIMRKKSTIGLIIATLGAGGIGLGGMLTLSLAPIAFIENITDDLNTQLTAIDVRGSHVFRNKIPKNAKKVLTGCKVLSIRCKLKTISSAQKNRLAAKGINVVDEKRAKIGGKWRSQPSKYQFQGVDYDAKAFSNELRKPTSALRTAYTRANNMKFLGMGDTSFKRVMHRFGVSKKPPELKGSKKDKVNILMNKANTSDPADVKFTKMTDKNGDPYYELDGDTSPDKAKYTEAQKNQMEKAVAGSKTAAPPSRAKAAAIKGLSVVGVVDMACTVKNMIGLASIAAKVANQMEFIQYAMRFASSVQKIKAGDGTVEDSEVVGEFVASTDSRKKIVDIKESVQVTGSGKGQKVGPVDGDIPMKDNPDYGKNALDSPLYKLSASGTYNSTSATEAQYSLGVGQNTVLKGYSEAATFMSVTDKGCALVQNWFVRGAGIVAGIALAVGSLGTTLVPQAAWAAGFFVATLSLQAIINNAISGSALSEGMEDAPLDRAAATWTGIAALQGESAKTRGMIPGTEKQIAAYYSVQNEVKATYVAVERSESGPFDIKNQYSFLGMFARSILPYVSTSTNVASAAGNILSLTNKSFASVLTGSNTHAATIDTTRFKQCDDKAYKDLKLAPDVQCNLRYVMPQVDLGREVEDVMDYMEDNGYVEKDTTTGLPVGYEPPSPQESQNFAMNMLNGFVDAFYNRRNYGEGKGAEYGKFLDYCAYRSLPFGKTYEENGAYGAVDEDWLTGKRCLSDETMISNFRVYTMDKSVSEAMDEDEIIPTSSNAEAVNQSDVVQSSGEWSSPAPAYTATAQAFGAPVGYDSTVKNSNGGWGHNGIDLSGTQKQEDIFAACDGTITHTLNPKLNLKERTTANTLTIDCGGGVTVGYHHATLDGSLQDNAKVKAGAKIGHTDKSGDWHGWHVHVTVSVSGRFTDPVPYFKDKGIALLK